jgi:cyclic pyranopterin phosphate synthase
MSGGRGDVATVLTAIEAAERAGFAPLKINAVIMRGVNETQAVDLVEHFRGTPHIVRFIEYMDVGTCNDWQKELVVPSAELRERIASRWPLVELEPNYGGEVARRYAFADGRGEIGFISSVSEPFCGDCSRARLSADGRLYTCLFASSGHDLRGPMRAGASDEDLAGLIRAVWNARDDRYSESRSELRLQQRERVEMYEIGG